MSTVAAVPLDPALVGKELPPLSVTVTRERAEAFASAIGATPATDGTAPPTFPTVLQIAAATRLSEDPEAGLDFARVLHGEEEYEWLRPPAVGDELTAAPRIARIAARDGSEFLTIESEIRDGSGELVVRARTMLIVRPPGTAEGHE